MTVAIRAAFFHIPRVDKELYTVALGWLARVELVAGLVFYLNAKVEAAVVPTHMDVGERILSLNPHQIRHWGVLVPLPKVAVNLGRLSRIGAGIDKVEKRSLREVEVGHLAGHLALFRSFFSGGENVF